MSCGLCRVPSKEGGPLRATAAGHLFDTSTWAADDKAAFFHTSDAVFGYALETGGHRLAMGGQFFFVHWMRVQNETLYLHCGESLGAIPLEEREGRVLAPQ